MRRLLTIVTGLALTSSGPAQEDLVETERRAKAFAALKQLGAVVVIDETKKDAPVLRVELSGPKVTDEALESIRNFRYLETLVLTQTRITDAGLKHLQVLPSLRVLMLMYTQVGDAGVATLAGLEKLEELGLSYTRVGDKGITELRNSKTLQSIYLSHTQVTDAMMPALMRMPKLTRVYLDGTAVTAAGIEKLKGTNVHYISFSGSRADRDGVDSYRKKAE